MRNDTRARRTKKAAPDNPRLQRPGWVRGTEEARPPAGGIVTLPALRVRSEGSGSGEGHTAAYKSASRPKSPATPTQFHPFLIVSDFE